MQKRLSEVISCVKSINYRWEKDKDNNTKYLYLQFIAYFLTLYVFYMMAILQIDRVMYLYHYFIPLIFTMILAGLNFTYLFEEQAVKHNKAIYISLAIIVIGVIAVYYFYSPLTYYEPLSTQEFMKRMWNVIEFKSCKETLAVDLIAKYIANGNLLASQMLLYKQKDLKSINEFSCLIMVSSNKVSDDIMVNFKQGEFRKGFYQLIDGGFLPVYLVVIDDLDIIPCNYPAWFIFNFCC